MSLFLYKSYTNNINKLHKYVLSCRKFCDMYMLTCPEPVINNDEVTNQYGFRNETKLYNLP